ncbi:ABC transporter ATP-binding protein [Panacibacter sp. DH6]|uniref:ABC transporter ATP-binding protein n=1 Tax=Panacibacter microcysteis TaxID=2793269 RepID=A0A931MDB0_9BACT|nr:ABC transporter ATP-binding protein [Panacibacter microcysteis]MBG9378487.1 ABC transporter ATP-binding protein [Panacibacter microcysteis]
MSAAIDISDVSFAYPGYPPVIANLHLTIQQGERFGLFGPNGAGKTTLMQLMTGLLAYKKGSIHLLGNKIQRQNKKANNLFGFVPQDFSFYHELSPKENLSFFGAWAGLTKPEIQRRSAHLLQVLGLEDVSDKPVQKFSGGMKRRVNLAIGVIHQPKVLFLDEPTVGVDVQSRHAIINYLKELNREGSTLVYTSHQLNEAEDLCTRIALFDEGRIIAHDTLPNLMAAHQQDGLEGLFLHLTGKTYRD